MTDSLISLLERGGAFSPPYWLALALLAALAAAILLLRAGWTLRQCTGRDPGLLATATRELSERRSIRGAADAALAEAGSAGRVLRAALLKYGAAGTAAVEAATAAAAHERKRWERGGQPAGWLSLAALLLGVAGSLDLARRAAGAGLQGDALLPALIGGGAGLLLLLVSVLQRAGRRRLQRRVDAILEAVPGLTRPPAAA